MQSQNTETLISLRGVTMQFDRKVTLNDINLDICRGDFIAITGPNGGGKTTLLRIILRLLDPSKGSVTYLGDKGSGKRLRIGYLPQKNLIDSSFPVTVKEVTAFGLMNTPDITKEERMRRIDDTIRLMGLSDHADNAISELSGGQLQRALIGRAIISRPEVLVMDEPLSYLDKDYEHKLYHIIEELAPTTTIILVSHEMSAIAGMANRHLIINHSLQECHASRHYAHDACDC
ncbi:ATP-binding cassette domain-containing protein [Barnesiella sp. WM24]|uniref:metal ABC transporter ATP-binding protein n=1 Tax=Barnesiella sp. WM24 TaxID=2558278 RepID=UPI00107261B9|nr:ATP-binding cassette domain-containing protein [Barnesiella sp. WM24]TFU95166.1 ATP-binding cassette domain-containing protein [Barnesiella sp. WM24]